MDCKEYRKRYAEFTESPLEKEVWDTPEYESWQDHGFDCGVCADWHLEQSVIERGHKLADFPCVHIAYHSTKTCEEHDDPWECPDMTLAKISDDEYCIPIRDGGSSFIEITHCPWCGIKL